MNTEDSLMYGFLIGLFFTLLEFLIFGVVAIVQFYDKNMAYFYISLAAPVVAAVSLIALLIRT